MEKLLTWMNRMVGMLYVPCKIPADKQGHFISGFILFFLLLACQVPALFAVAGVSLVGVAKEVYDHYHPLEHTADVYDWLATTLGGVAGFWLWWLV